MDMFIGCMLWLWDERVTQEAPRIDRAVKPTSALNSYLMA